MSGITLGRIIGLLFLEAGRYTLNALLYDVPMTVLSWATYTQLNRTTPE